jgi:hypothetical protein
MNQHAGYISDLMSLKKKMEAPKNLKPIDLQANLVSIPGEDYQKLDYNRKIGIHTYFAKKADHNLINRNDQRSTMASTKYSDYGYTPKLPRISDQ